MKNKRKNNKGFTLVELLAVIVIMGILMMAAMPLVLNQIQNSKVKSVVSSIDSYVKTVMGEANYLTYDFTAENTIFAIPIECIALEQGGEQALGQWLHANDDYWAYVLVQYDSEAPTYKYAFTFKDSLGYSLYPTSIDLIKEKSKLIKLELDVTKPQTGLYTSYTSEENWEKSGFELNETTQLRVLEAESDGILGDGVNTCTLCQKGDNYAQVEEEKQNTDELPMLNSLNSILANNDIPYFYGMIDRIKSITFETSINIPNGTDTYDFTATKNGKVISFVRNHPTESGYYDLAIQGDGAVYANPDSSYLFSIFPSLNKINNIHLLNTSKVENMQAMFSHIPIAELNLSSWDTRKVTNMSYMFQSTGIGAGQFKVTLGFDTSNVTNMSHMFDVVDDIDGLKTIYEINLGDKFNTSKVTDMSSMFSGVGMQNESFSLDLGNKFDTRNVTNMSLMFAGMAYSTTTFSLNLGDKFDTSNVTNMDRMFVNVGRSSRPFTIDCSNWNVDKVTNYEYFNADTEENIIPPVWKH